MSDYGLTTKGVNIKRLDTILDEMHSDLTKKWGVNTRQNQTSLLNAFLTNIADELAELWELGEDVYNNTYPNSAEGVYLDNAAQFAGIMREEKAKSYYHVLCTGTEGTTIPSSTLVCTDMNPITELKPTSDSQILRTQFNRAWIKAVTVDGNPFTVVLNGVSYSITPDKGTAQGEALQALSEAINDSAFTSEIDADTGNLLISAIESTSQNILILSDNLTTEKVGCVFLFETSEYGDIYLPEGSVSVIEKSVTGLETVSNVGTYIAGRLDETDSEFRQSYIDKIFSHSSRMTDSIQSAILTNVQGVTSIAVYENCDDTADDQGRPPHSIEVVCDGGDSSEIAQQILDTKAGGINTYGSTEVRVQGSYNDMITIRFNRPEYVNVWFHVELAIAHGMSIASNYAELARDIIVDTVNALECGDDVIPQNIFMPKMYSQIYGIDYVEVRMGTGNVKPSEYSDRNVYLTERQRAVTDGTKVEVVLNG